MDNKNFTLICENCGNKITLTDGIDTFLPTIQMVALRGFQIEIMCNNCENSIETE